MYEIGIKGLYQLTIYPRQVPEPTVLEKRIPSLSTRVIT